MIIKNIGESFSPLELVGETSRVNNGVTITVYEGDEPMASQTLPQLKATVCIIIDEETTNNIFKGFTFGGLVFSMSLTAQINWSNFPMLPSSAFPLTIMSKNDEEYALAEANKLLFYGTALAYKNGCLQAGNAKKILVKECTTINDVKTLADSWGFSY